MNYQELGLKCGLEIHQQLDGRKLFCPTPTIIRDDKPDHTVMRKLRGAVGETGKLDQAAAHEVKKEKTFEYESYDETTGLVELDEEPPHNMSEQALNTVLQFCKMVSAPVVDQVHVMRKTIVDGSNTSGFQRTALVARNGILPVNNKDIRIESICIEEDAARIMSQSTKKTVYRLDRLGIGLIEVATSPDIRSPEECKAVAETIGMYLRSTGTVKRGLGTIRQDVNVSIKEGVRVEIKGAQDLRLLPDIVKFEAQRQNTLLQLFNELHNKQATVGKIEDVTACFMNTQAKVVKNALNKKGIILGLKLEHFAGYLGKETQPGRRLGSEYSDHAKLMGAGGLFHSDELPHYGISEEEVNNVKEVLRCTPQDAFVIIADTELVARKAITAVQEVARHLHLIEGVRKALPDGTSSYLRPMPGSSRMYPETDILPFSPDGNVTVPELLTEKSKSYQSFGLSKDLADAAVNQYIDVPLLIKKYPNIKTSFLVELVFTAAKEVKTRANVDLGASTFFVGYPKLYDAPKFAELLTALDKGTLPKEAVFDALVELAKGKVVDYSSMNVNDDDLRKEIQTLIANNKDASKNAIMGLAMKQYRGKVSGKKINELLSSLM